MRRRLGHDGFTLIELLVTVVIMGTAFVVLVGGTLTGVIASNTHREKADGEIVLRQFIDYVKTRPYKKCDEDQASYVPPPAEFVGFKLHIDECKPVPPEDAEAGLQKLQLVVDPLNGQDQPDLHARQTIEIVKRKPGNP